MHRLILCLVVWTGWTSTAAAQEFAGFRGRVTDPAQAGVPQARVLATEETTGFEHRALTNEAGDYELRGLQRGVFTLQVEAAGFKRYVNQKVILYPGQIRRVDAPLEIGDLKQSVEVVSEASVIETDTATVTNRQAKTEIYHLNRQTAGWLIYTTENHPGQQLRSQVHGSFANSVLAAQDGIALMGYSQQGRLPQEVVQDISQVSINAPAEHQHATTVVGSGRRGGNDLHGEVFLEYRHLALNALSVGQTVRQPAAPTTRWSFDGSGPVRIPKLYNGSNKTFFRFLYQPQQVNVVETLDGYDAPTQALRDGNLTAVARGAGIVDPLTAQPFPGNVIPASRFSPAAVRTMQLIPLPNFGPAGRLTDNFRFFNSNNESNYWLHLRGDHQLSSRNNLSVTFLRFRRVTDHTADDHPETSPIDRVGTTFAYSIRDTHLIKPNIVNEFSLAFNKQDLRSNNGQFTGKDLLNRLGISASGRTLPDALGGPLINLTNFRSNRNTSIIGGRGNQETLNTDAHVTTVRNSLSFVWRRHLFKTGFDLNWQRPSSDAIGPGSFGNINFTGNFTTSDWGDFLLGLPFTTSIATPRIPLRSRHLELGFYFQDDWKVNNRLTITPGIRFQHYGVPFDASGLYYNFDVESRRIIVPNEAALAQVNPAFPRDIPIVTAKQAGFPGRLANFKPLLADPRLGIAYRPAANWVLRAAYGIYHVPYARPTAASAGEVLPGRIGGPFALTESYGPNRITAGRPAFTFDNPFPTGPGAAPLQSPSSLPVNMRSDQWSYDQQWNATLEKNLPWAIGLRASYVGTKGTHWPYTRNLQMPQASTERFAASRRPFGAAPYQAIILNELGGNSSYHGFELEVHRQFSSGLYFRAWYDFRKSLSDIDGGLFGDSQGSASEYSYSRSRDKGWQDGISPHSARFTAVYELPIGRGKRLAKDVPVWLNPVVSGWTLAPFLTITQGQRYTPIFSGADPAGLGISSGRASATCNANGFGSFPGVAWNRACFSIPATGTLGSASRGSLSGPSVYQTAFNMFKNFKLGSRDKSPYLRIEFYSNNILNHSNATVLASNDITNRNFGEFRVQGVDTRVIYFRARLGF